MSSKPDTVAPEQLTDEERHELLTVKALRGSGTLDKLLRIHDRYKARVEELELRWSGEKANHNCTVADAQAAIDKAEARIRELETIITQARAEGFGVIRGKDLDEPKTPNRRLHEALDLLLAQHIQANDGKLPSNTTVMELLQWSHSRLTVS